MESYHYDLFYNKPDLAASLVILKKKKKSVRVRVGVTPQLRALRKTINHSYIYTDDLS